MARKEWLNKIMGRMRMEAGEEGLINYWKGFGLHSKGVGDYHKVFKCGRSVDKDFSREDKVEMEGETEAGAHQGKEWSVSQRASIWLPGPTACPS